MIRTQQPSAAIIGAGIAGIATAIRLAKAGYSVHVYETNATPGGKLAEIKEQGFRFDAGPSLFTLPELVDELFDLCGLPAAAYFSYEKLDEICGYYYEDGTRLTAYANPEDFAKEIEQKTSEKSTSILKYLHNSKFLYDLTSSLFLQSSLHTWRTYTTKQAWRALWHLPRLDTHRTLAKANKVSFNDPRVQQLFNRYATYNGSDPYQAPATLSIIPHLEYNQGAYFPRGGMYSIVASLVTLAQAQSVQFHYQQRVEKITIADSKVTGIIANSSFVPHDVVVSTMDVLPTYKRLLSGEPYPTRALSQERSSSALVFYWGIEGIFPELGLHTIFFAANYEAEFKALFTDKSLYHDPTVYLNISSKKNLSDAPPGCENWFTMINVPANYGQDWEEYILLARMHILKKLSRNLGRDIEPLIRFEKILDPRSIEANTGSAYGSLYGTSSNSRFAAFLRHPNFSSHLKNLYFAGGSVHPGGGIPLCLYSAKIASKQILKDRR